jgi:catechol 2,3-dioxygenase-like lactoylglutathione lyase family enzyme
MGASGSAQGPPSPQCRRIDLVTVVVEEYDPAISFFVDVLGFELAEDSPSLTKVPPPPARRGHRRRLARTPA